MCCSKHHSDSDFICLFHLHDPHKDAVVCAAQVTFTVKQWKKSSQPREAYVIPFSSYYRVVDPSMRVRVHPPSQPPPSYPPLSLTDPPPPLPP